MSFITANVAMSDTGMVIMGIITARQFYKNREYHQHHDEVVSKKVMITSSIDADTKSVVLRNHGESPLRKILLQVFEFFSTVEATFTAFAPGSW